jgi:hypothetical protein
MARETIGALREGFSRLRRSFGLVFVVLAANLGLAALLAAPLYGRLRSAFENREAAATNLYGFDASWWGAWKDAQSGFARDFGPEIVGGAGFAFRNLELLLQGRLPAGLFAWTHEGEGSRVDPLVLGLGLAYLVLQTFLAGGLIGVFRTPRGGWTLRGLVHGSGFYFGRLVRVALVGLALSALVFGLNAPFARFADQQAREAVSETSALLWAFGRHLLLLLVLLLLSLLSGYAKVIVVVEERSSALLAWVSAAGFCLRRAGLVLGHYFAVVALALAVLAMWTALDAAWTTTGYRSQVVALLLMEGLVAARIGLRLGLLAGQTALYRAHA